MAIIDQYGNPFKPFAHGAVAAGSLPWQKYRIRGIDDLIPVSDWRALVSASRELFANFGPLRGAIEQKAMWSVGNAWVPRFLGADREWGQAAAEWLETWFNACDVRGAPYDFRTSLYLDSVSIDRDGDVLVVLTKTKDGWPQLQHIPAHRIGCVESETVVETGRYRGRKIVNGVILDRNQRTMAYRIITDPEKREFKDVSSYNVIFPFDPSWQDQTRGIPLAIHAIGDFRSSKQSAEWEMWAQLIASSIALIETNESGGPEADDPTVAYPGASGAGSGGVAQELMDGGMIRYFGSETGSKIETLRYERPTPEWNAFQDRIIRSGCAGIGWPYELAWKNDGNAATQRSILAQADKAIVDRQVLMEWIARREAAFAVGTAVASGILPPNEEFWRWSFSKPRKITIDAGRDATSRLKEFDAGIKTLTDIATEEGGTLDDLLYKRAYEIARAEQIRQEVEAETGYAVDPSKMPLLDGNQST